MTVPPYVPLGPSPPRDVVEHVLTYLLDRASDPVPESVPSHVTLPISFDTSGGYLEACRLTYRVLGEEGHDFLREAFSLDEGALQESWSSACESEGDEGARSWKPHQLVTVARAYGPVSPQKTEKEGPDEVVFKFLEAVRTGDPETAEKMLTAVALEETRKRGFDVAPPGSSTASFGRRSRT